ncbi:MAG: DUF5677 domain-containing protein [Elainellaceae cyanobacterium]
MNNTTANQLLGKLLQECRSKTGSGTDLLFMGFEYESSVAAMMQVVLQHAEAFHELALNGEKHFFTCAACARSALETSMRTAWICKPSEQIQKEGRWAGYSRSLEKFYRAMNNELEDEDPELWEDSQKVLDLTRSITERKIDGRDIPIVAPPNLRDMMKEAGYEPLYPSYRELCQAVHVGPEVVLRHRETMKFLDDLPGYRILSNPLDTGLEVPFLVIGFSIALSVITVLNELGDSNESLKPIHIAQKNLTGYVQSQLSQQEQAGVGRRI